MASQKIVATAAIKALAAEIRCLADGLNEEVLQIRQALNEVRADANDVVEANQKLIADLKREVQRQLDDRTAPKSYSPSLVQNLQDERDHALQAKDNAMQLWKSTLKETEKLQLALNERKEYIAPEDFRAAIVELKKQHSGQVEALERKYSSAIEQLKEAQKSVQQLTWKVLKTTRTSLLDDEQNGINVNDILSTLDETRKSLLQLERRAQELEIELEDVKHDRDAWKQRSEENNAKIKEIAQKCAELDARLDEACIHAQTSLQTAESAVAERDAILDRARAFERERDELNEALDLMAKQAAEKAFAEIEKARIAWNDKTRDLVQKVAQMAQNEKSLREQLNANLEDRDALRNRLKQLVEERSRLTTEAVSQIDKIRSDCKQRIDDLQARYNAEVERRLAFEARYDAAALEWSEKLRLAFESKCEIERQAAVASERCNNLEHELAECRQKLQATKKDERSAFETEKGVLEERFSSLQRERDDALESKNELEKKVLATELALQKQQDEFKMKFCKLQKKALHYKATLKMLHQQMESDTNPIAATIVEPEIL